MGGYVTIGGLLHIICVEDKGRRIRERQMGVCYYRKLMLAQELLF